MSAVEAELDRVNQGKENRSEVKNKQLLLFKALTQDISEPTIGLIAKLNSDAKRVLNQNDNFRNVHHLRYCCVQFLQKKCTCWVLLCLKLKTMVKHYIHTLIIWSWSVNSSLSFPPSSLPFPSLSSAANEVDYLMKLAANLFGYSGEQGDHNASYTYAQLLRTGH